MKHFRQSCMTAQITFKGKNYYLGRYDDIEDAARARKVAEELEKEQ